MESEKDLLVAYLVLDCQMWMMSAARTAATNSRYMTSRRTERAQVKLPPLRMMATVATASR